VVKRVHSFNIGSGMVPFPIIEVYTLSILCRCYVCVYAFVLMIMHVVACAGVIVACGD